MWFVHFKTTLLGPNKLTNCKLLPLSRQAIWQTNRATNWWSQHLTVAWLCTTSHSSLEVVMTGQRVATVIWPDLMCDYRKLSTDCAPAFGETGGEAYVRSRGRTLLNRRDSHFKSSTGFHLGDGKGWHHPLERIRHPLTSFGNTKCVIIEINSWLAGNAQRRSNSINMTLIGSLWNFWNRHALLVHIRAGTDYRLIANRN